ncbi:MAG TPA: metalloregulator ArsR/SmtB family transcription factor [bacterium]|mgnify:FL=1|nr:metalloregulator ArsR/SmtB family transcription factor [bacterium]HPN33638.1 metalloregulator ArsR/SmtB family transcription factor [bacterium]
MELDKLFQALADPTRRKIVQLLKKQDQTPSDLLQKIKVSQPTLSHHLDILKRANLIDGAREGQYIRYSLNMSVFQMSVDYLMKFIGKE